LRPNTVIQSRVMLKESQDKVSLMQGSLWGGNAVGSFLGAWSIGFACRFFHRVLEIWENKTRSVCSLLALLRCNFEHLSRNKESFPTGKMPEDVGKHCAELRYQPAFLWFVVYYSFQICICIFECHNSSSFLILSLNSQMVNEYMQV
jgi:hypothetical protein